MSKSGLVPKRRNHMVAKCPRDIWHRAPQPRAFIPFISLPSHYRSSPAESEFYSNVYGLPLLQSATPQFQSSFYGPGGGDAAPDTTLNNSNLAGDPRHFTHDQRVGSLSRAHGMGNLVAEGYDHQSLPGPRRLPTPKADQKVGSTQDSFITMAAGCVGSSRDEYPPSQHSSRSPNSSPSSPANQSHCRDLSHPAIAAQPTSR